MYCTVKWMNLLTHCCSSLFSANASQNRTYAYDFKGEIIGKLENEIVQKVSPSVQLYYGI